MAIRISRLILALLISLIIMTDLSFAQNQCRIRQLSPITLTVFPYAPGITQHDKILLDAMKMELLNKNMRIVENGKEYYDFYLGTKDLPNENEVIASVLVFDKIPEEVVQIGAKNEALYAVVGTEKPKDITPGGDNIRKMMSAEYMRNFGQVENYYVAKINLKNADTFCQNVIKNFLVDNKKKQKGH
jgi:hypothetical protein